MSSRQAENSRHVICPECGIQIAAQGKGWGNTSPPSSVLPPPPRAQIHCICKLEKHVRKQVCVAQRTALGPARFSGSVSGGSNNRKNAHVVGFFHVMLLRTLACSLRSIALVLHWHSCSDKLQLRGKKKEKKGEMVAVTCNYRAAPFYCHLASLMSISCETF